MKIFRLNDYEWWAGEDLESVKKEFLKQTGLDEDEAFDDPDELNDEQMEALIMIKKINEVEYAKVGTYTFKAFLDLMIKNNCVFPCFFASSEY